MANVSIARRYARALLDVAQEAGSLDKVLQQLEAFSRSLDASPELKDIAVNPSYTRAQRFKVAEEVLKLQGPTEPSVTNLIRLLVDRDRLIAIPDITRIFRDMVDLRAGRVRGKVISAVSLPKESLQKIEKTFEKITQRNVVLESKVDPSLIGGVSTQVGSVLYDGSIRTQIEDLRRTLKAQ